MYTQCELKVFHTKFQLCWTSCWGARDSRIGVIYGNNAVFRFNYFSFTYFFNLDYYIIIFQRAFPIFLTILKDISTINTNTKYLR